MVAVPLGEVGQAEPPVVPAAVASEHHQHHDHEDEDEDEDDLGDDEEDDHDEDKDDHRGDDEILVHERPTQLPFAKNLFLPRCSCTSSLSSSAPSSLS